MIRIIDVALLSLILLLGIVNTARTWEYLSRKRERAVTVAYLGLIASIHYSTVIALFAGAPVRSGSYVMFFFLAWMLVVSVRNTFKNGHRS